jgi:hypothetical protein
MSEDYQAMKENRKIMIDALAKRVKSESSNSDEDEEEKYCSQGLCTTAESFRRITIVRGALLAVLTEQEFQWDEGVNDPELLADVVFQCTFDSQWMAMDRGMSLAEEVKKVNSTSDSQRKVLPKAQTLPSTTTTPKKNKSPKKKVGKQDHLLKKNTARHSSTVRLLASLPNILSPSKKNSWGAKKEKVPVADLLRDALMVVGQASS